MVQSCVLGKTIDRVQTKWITKLFIDELTHYYFGRNLEHCEVVVEHASCSRIHALLVYHKHLSRFALIDLGSSHGTFVSDTRISPMKPVFLDIGTKFHFGVSTRRFIIREKYEAKVQEPEAAQGPAKRILPEDEEELDHLTEYNTAQNLRIPVIEQTIDEARAKRKPRNKICFAAEDIVIDLAHGTFVSDTRISPMKPVFLDIGTKFHFGVSTRRFIIREKYEAKVQEPEAAQGPAKQILPEDEEELDHLTEYNTAQNLRIPVIEQTVDEARAKRKPRNKICFAAEDIVIDLDDPTLGRFANLVQTAIVPRKRRLDDVELDFPSIAKKPKAQLRKLSDFAKPRDNDDVDEFASILGVRMNAAPDLDHMEDSSEVNAEASSSTPLLVGDDEHHQHKKYVKEVWPGRKPAPIVN
uniref:FHA domain-containing protein n=1 Tax=Panagrellus redivivus TaxID=6233 RepID=A0A7E4ZT72_PANRE